VKRIYLLVRLRPGVAPEDYERFVREIDLHTAPSVLPIESYEVIRLEGRIAKDDSATFDYLEIVQVPDLEKFRAALAAPSEPLQALMQQAFTFLEESTVLDFVGEAVS
jgi:hypothetical protein